MFHSVCPSHHCGNCGVDAEIDLVPPLGIPREVVLANSEYRHELESDIEPFKGLLLGLFFIAVGASMDFNYILQQPLRIIMWVFILLFVKRE
jgi:predicted Kef-type K+ transport protein